MILVIEPIFPNAHHAPGNAGKLAAILIAAGDEPVVFAAHPLHHAAVRRVLGDAKMPNLTVTDIEVLPPGGLSVRRFLSQTKALLGLTRRLWPRLAIKLVPTIAEA